MPDALVECYCPFEELSHREFLVANPLGAANGRWCVYAPQTDIHADIVEYCQISTGGVDMIGSYDRVLPHFLSEEGRVLRANLAWGVLALPLAHRSLGWQPSSQLWAR